MKEDIQYQHFTPRQVISLALMLGAIILNVVGIFKFEWTFGEMSANFYSQVY